MPSDREARQALPTYISSYDVKGDVVTYHKRTPTPGKSYLEPKDVLVRVYNGTIARNGGFSGEIIAIGDHIDSFGINDYVYGGGKPCLQQFITVRAEEIATKPRDLCFADASRLYAGVAIYEALKNVQEETTVLILGDMTGFAAQICREKGCFVTSSENFDCGEQNIIEGDNFLDWLQSHTFTYDYVLDATGDVDLYYHCHTFTHKRAEYISVEPPSSMEVGVTSFLPTFLGGGSRKFSVIRSPKGPKRAAILSLLAQKVLDGTYEIKNPRIISLDAVTQINPHKRYVTAVNVIQQKDITPEDPEYNLKEGRAATRTPKDKGKNTVSRRRNEVRHAPPSRTPSPLRQSAGSPASSFDGLTSSPIRVPPLPVINSYSPRRPSGLVHSVSASNLSEIQQQTSPEPNGLGSPPSNRSRGSLGGSPVLASSPKFPMIQRPPALRRHTTASEEHVFEEIELQRVMRSPSMSQDGEWETDDESTPLQAYLYSEPGARTATSTTSPDAQRAATTRRSVPNSPETAKAEELRLAKEQIEALRRQVETLMASQTQVSSH